MDIRYAAAAALLLLWQSPAPGPAWTTLQSNVTSRLRGVSVVSDRVAWASGAGGTVLRTEDGGRSWQRLAVPDSEKLDFRDVDAVDHRTAYILSIGPGDQSRIYRTDDAGKTWTLQFRNTEAKAFYDAMTLVDADRGVAIGDSIDGQFVVLHTENGGRTWTRLSQGLPPALPNEGAFAASGSNIAVFVGSHVWIGTGAAAEARVLFSHDHMRTWSVASTPLRAGPSAGIFSIAFRDALNGIVVGGDYTKESEATDNAAITKDGGKTWTTIAGLSGFRSAVAYVPGTNGRRVLAVGPSGADYSEDGGLTWKRLEGPGYHAFAFAPRTAVGYGVGEGGRIGVLDLR